MNFQVIKDAALQIKDKLSKPSLNDTLVEATSNENWNTPTKLLQEISEATFGFTQCDMIMKFIWKRLDSDNCKWRRILKTLNIIEYLSKNGAPRFVGEFQDSIFKLRSFSDFTLIEQGSDKGLSSCRIEQILYQFEKKVNNLLIYSVMINRQKKKEKTLRKFENVQLESQLLQLFQVAGGIGFIGSDTNYQSYGSDTYKNDSYKGYGSDSYNNDTIGNNKIESTTTTKSNYQTY